MKPLHIFININKLLSFDHSADDDYQAIEDLKISVVNDDVILHIPKQALEEFNRNRQEK